MNLHQEFLIIPEGTNENVLQPLILPSRSNCVLLLNSDKEINHDVVTIRKQNVAEDVVIANSLSPVRGKKFISSIIINILGLPIVIDPLSTSNLNWEPYADRIFQVDFNNNNNKECQTRNRIKMIHELVKTDHLNSKKRERLIELIKQHSDIFFFFFWRETN